VIPRSWTPSGDLWIAEGGRTARGRTPLLRVNARSGETLERRSIGPADPTGASALVDVVLSPDGSEFAFTCGRFLNNLNLAQVSGADGLGSAVDQGVTRRLPPGTGCHVVKRQRRPSRVGCHRNPFENELLAGLNGNPLRSECCGTKPSAFYRARERGNEVLPSGRRGEPES
jgi:hypothetical protein